MVDKLNRKIAVGDDVYTKGYYSCDLNLLTQVKKINPTKIVMTATSRNYRAKAIKNITRYPSECIVVTEQLAYNRQTWPENYI